MVLVTVFWPHATCDMHWPVPKSELWPNSKSCGQIQNQTVLLVGLNMDLLCGVA